MSRFQGEHDANEFPQTVVGRLADQFIRKWYSFFYCVFGFKSKGMKRVSVFVALGVAGWFMMSAEQGTVSAERKAEKKACVGYTIIEASKGIDCNGDTIRLVRTAGFYERVREDDPS